MPEVLQSFAERELCRLAEDRTRLEDELRELNTAPEAIRRNQPLNAARLAAFLVAKSAEATELWMTFVDDKLRQGLSVEVLGNFTEFGSELVRGQLAFAELAGQLWDNAEKLGAAPDEVVAARSDVAAARARILVVKSRTDRLARLVKTQPPAIAAADIERGAEAIRRGEFLTPEQAVAHFRRTRE